MSVHMWTTDESANEVLARLLEAQRVGRIEVVYLFARALGASLGGPAPAARISPGEYFHAIEVNRRWIIDWYQARSVGITLHGPAAVDVMPAIPREEYVEAVRGYLLDPDWLESLDAVGDRCYAVLTMCRGLRTIQTGDYVTKREGARWASATMPGYASLIAAALGWKVAPPEERDDSTLPDDEVRRLVIDLQQRILIA